MSLGPFASVNRARTLAALAAAAAALVLLAALLGGGAASGAPGPRALAVDALERVAQRIGDAWQLGPRPERPAPLRLAWTAVRTVAATAGLAWVAAASIVIDTAEGGT
jgi:hypothetical protein